MDKTGRNGLRWVIDQEFHNTVYQTAFKTPSDCSIISIFKEDIGTWEEEFFDALEFLKGFNIVNGEYFINEKIAQGKKVLAEGAQGSMLDVDFGNLPLVTSSSTISAGVCSGLGIAPQKIKRGDLVSPKLIARGWEAVLFQPELLDETGELLHGKTGNEYGSTTGRPRRCGWIDGVALRFACMRSTG